MKSLPPDMRAVLEKLRAAIKSAAPKAEELISYQIPTYKYHGPLVHFAAFKDHCSFVVVSKKTLSKFSQDLVGYKISGTTVHFTPDHPLPTALIKRIVKARVRENVARAKAKEV